MCGSYNFPVPSFDGPWNLGLFCFETRFLVARLSLNSLTLLPLLPMCWDYSPELQLLVYYFRLVKSPASLA